ncbi:coniferyl aldehyde dehydrogenase [Acidovorax anthurii]
MKTDHISEDLQSIVRAMQRAHVQAGAASAALRRDRLGRAVQLLQENRQGIAQAISADFGHRSEFQSLTADLLTPTHSLRYAAEHLEQWMQPEKVAAPAHGMSAWIQPQPLGVVGIISPWNFPINLAFGPLAGVFAAGNTALLKPSELTPRTSDLLAELVGRYFDPMEFGVVLGDASVGAAFSGLPFDHLVFTGSTTVGRHVMRAAAENLVPVTLELGGKSPVVIDDDADVRVAAERVLTVKAFNAGQICLSPDYVLMPKDRQDAFVAAAREFLARTYPTMQSNPDYTAIISDRHFQRLVQLIEDARAKGARVVGLAPAGEPGFDAATRKIAPHLLLDVDDSMQVMQEEIFGPLLPIRGYDRRDEPIGYINAHPRPLAAYYFGEDAARQQAFAAGTTSGALVFNDVMSHSVIEGLPFGGVGASGMGAYHGVHGFRRFTHAKAVVQQSNEGASGLRLRAPYADKMAAVQAAFS